MNASETINRYTIRGIDATTGNPSAFAYTRVHLEGDDGEWKNFSWEIDIASTRGELSANVEKALNRVGRDNTVFDVFDHAGNLVATEETLE